MGENLSVRVRQCTFRNCHGSGAVNHLDDGVELFSHRNWTHHFHIKVDCVVTNADRRANGRFIAQKKRGGSLRPFPLINWLADLLLSADGSRAACAKRAILLVADEAELGHTRLLDDPQYVG